MHNFSRLSACLPAYLLRTLLTWNDCLIFLFSPPCANSLSATYVSASSSSVSRFYLAVNCIPNSVKKSFVTRKREKERERRRQRSRSRRSRYFFLSCFSFEEMSIFFSVKYIWLKVLPPNKRQCARLPLFILDKKILVSRKRKKTYHANFAYFWLLLWRQKKFRYFRRKSQIFDAKNSTEKEILLIP